MSDNNPTTTSVSRNHQFTLRLNDEEHNRLKTIAGNGKMSDVLLRGLNAEWEYHQNVQSVIQKLPKFNNPDELARWTAIKFKTSPVLMNKYSNAAAIRDYTNSIKAKHNAYQLLINEFDTTNYLIRAIGNNLNQLARHANSGGTVNRNELAQCTQAIMKLSGIVDDIRKEVTK